jgi:type I restriction enzyme, S subunit
MNAERLLAYYEQIADASEAIARLRRFILDLAVRGKLLSQDPNDEPASELLKRIAKEKARLVKAGELRKPRDLDSGNDLNEPFAIPMTWRWVRLDAVGAIVGGGTPSAADADNFAEPGEGVPWLTPADLGGYSDLYISRGSRDLSEKGSRSSSATVMPKGSVLFTSRAPIGYVAIASNPLSTNQGFKSIVPYIADCSRFVATAMKAFAPEIDAKAPGTTFKEVSGKIVAAIPFPLPPLAEQHRIVAKVDELMGLCDRLETARGGRERSRDRLAAASLARLNAPDPATFQVDARFALDALPALTTRPDQIKALRQTILNLAVRGKLVPKDRNDEPASELLKRIAKERTGPQAAKNARRNGETDISNLRADTPLPVGWRWTKIGEIALSMRYGTSTKCEYAAPGVPVLRIPNVSDGIISLDDIKFGPLTEGEVRDLALKAGDLLMIRSNGSLDIVGRSAVVTAEADGMAFAGYLVRLRLSLANIKSEYIWLALNSADVRDQIERPIRSAVGLKNVNLTEFGALTFPLPPLAEQHRIVAKVDALMALCDRLEASLNATVATRRRLLDALLAETLMPAEDRELEAAE